MAKENTIDGVEDNTELLAGLANLETLTKTNESLIERISFLEKENKKAFEKRDKANQTLKDIKDETETGNEAELDNLKLQIQEANDFKDKAQNDFENYKSETALEQAIQLAGVQADSTNAKTFNIITQLLKEGAVFENGEIVYKNEDGTTLYENGVQTSIESRLAQIKSDTDFAGLFKPKVQSGSGSRASSGASINVDVSKMGYAEKGKLMKELGSEKYFELVKRGIRK